MSGNEQIQSKPQDFRGVLREKAINHSLYYAGSLAQPTIEAGAAVLEPPNCNRDSGSGCSALPRAARTARASLHALPSVSELRTRYESATSMQYLRPPRTPSPDDDITFSDDDERVAVRRRSRELSDDSAIEVEPHPRRHSHPREVTPPPESVQGAASSGRDRTLIEEHVVELGRRRSSDGVEIRGRCVRVPSVVISDYSDGGSSVAPTNEEIEWLRSKWLGADSACSSTSTLSSREDEHYDPPAPVASKRDNLDERDEVTPDNMTASTSHEESESQNHE